MTVIYNGEDSSLHQELVTATLETLSDVQLKHYSDGLDLYLDVLNSPPDLLLLDIILPSLSGLAVAGLLKRHGRLQQIPIIMISSIMDADIETRAQRAGAELFLHKPYDPMQLIAAVQRLQKKTDVPAAAGT